MAATVSDVAPGGGARSGPTHLRLREATAALHREVEDQLDLRRGLTLDRYRRILEVFHGYYAPLEPRLAAAAQVGPPRGFSLVHRTPRIECDLLALGASRADLDNLPRCGDLPTIEVSADLAGCLYVIEGASLGGQVISRIVERRLGITAPNGGSFFTGEGASTGARWNAVLAWIEQITAAEACSHAVVESACETFRTIGRWFERHLEIGQERQT